MSYLIRILERIVAYLLRIDRDIQQISKRLLVIEQKQNDGLELLGEIRRTELVLLANQADFAVAFEALQVTVDKILAAVTPETVASVTLLVDGEELSEMDIQTAQTSLLSFIAKGASGNPTTPVGAPAFAVDSPSFVVTPSADGMTAVVSVAPGAAVGDSGNATVVVDGVTSNAISFTVAATAPEPVASVELSATTPA